MENVNRNDVINFFTDMPINLQQEAIRKFNRQRKPPDAVQSLCEFQQREWEQIKADRAESNGDPISNG
jgi:hypothetical protein